jgi:hypothetical protein
VPVSVLIRRLSIAEVHGAAAGPVGRRGRAAQRGTSSASAAHPAAAAQVLDEFDHGTRRLAR